MAKIVYEVVADTRQAEKEIDNFTSKVENTDPKFELDDVVNDESIQNFTKQIEYLEIKAEDLKEKLRQIDIGGGTDVFKLEAELERTLNQREKLKQKQIELNQETAKNVQEERNLGNEVQNTKIKQQEVNNETKNHSFHLGDIIRKVSRWGLAIIGVRSAYSGIRRAISLVSSSNDAVAQKMEQMRNVLVGAITPVVEFIVNLLMKAMKFINTITTALFGKAIFDFSNATKSANKSMGGISTSAGKTAKSVGSATKSLKQASKIIAGFDEINVLSDNSSSGGGTSGGGGGIGGAGGVGGLDTSGLTNAFDDLKNLKIPEWLGSVARALEYVIAPYKFMIEAIEEEIRLQKIRKDNEAGLRADNKKRQKSLEKEGTQIIKNVKAGKQLTEQEFVYIRGIEDEIRNLTKKGKLSDAEKERLKILTNRYGDLYREGALNNSQMELYKVLTGKTKVAEEDRLDVLDNLIDQSIEEYKASTNMADANEQVAQSTKDGKYWMDKYGVTLETITKNAGLTTEQTDELRDALNKYDKSDKGPRALLELQDTIAKVGKKAGLSKEEIEKLQKNISNMKSKDINVNVKTPSTTELKNIGIKIGKAINSGFDSVVDLALNVTGNKKGNRKGALIKYAKGGIINQPGRGVPIHVGGEAGREGIVPLTDSQQMALLGEAIGKYITINANITNSMNGRVISRELQKIQNEQSFASNRW